MALKFTVLTRAALKALTPGGTLREHGIAVERTAKGDLIYRASLMVDGERIHRTIGKESEGVTRETVEREIETLRTRAREGRLDLPKGRKTHRSFAEVATDYLKRMEETGGRDFCNKRRHVEQRLVPYFGRLRANAISSLDIQRYTMARLKDAKQSTVNRELSTLSHLLNRAIEWKWITADFKPKIHKGAETPKPITVLTVYECSKLMKAAKDDSDDRLYLFVAFGLNAAMRHSEIVAVRYDQIDFSNRRIFIPVAKAGSREQPLTPALTDMLAKDRETASDKDGWVFPAKASAKTKAARDSHRPSMEYGFKRAVVRAGLDPAKVTPHILRHTAITRLVKAGVDLPTIQRISAHKTYSMVLRYTHVHGRHIDDAIKALELG
jgi:integrase